MKRILGIDYGKKRIGYSIADDQKKFMIERTIPASGIVNVVLCGIVERYHVDTIVIGLPLNLKGNFTDSTKDALLFCNKIFEWTKLPVYVADERFSTSVIYTVETFLGNSQKQTRKQIDAKSAGEILSVFLAAPENSYLFNKTLMKKRVVEEKLKEKESLFVSSAEPISIVFEGAYNFYSVFEHSQRTWAIKEKNPWFYMLNYEIDRPDNIVSYQFYLGKTECL